ncbi:unnamed protein product, partial [Polarella glacialis]
LQRNVQQALAAGVRVEYHVACEEHLFFARRLPLPRSSLMVHPVNGRIARLMERGGLLLPLLVDLIAELQVPGGHGRRPWAESVQFSNEMQAKAADGQNLQQMGWDWSDSEERLLLARWCSDGRLSFARISGKALASLCKKVPSPGQWFCARCLCCNDAKVEVCAACQNASLPPLRKVGEAPSPDDVARLRETGVSALASSEDALEDGELPPYWLLQSTDGNQTWAWAEFGLQRNGFIQLLRGGRLETSWGPGLWRCRGRRLEVSFGDPEFTWLLERNSQGFRGVAHGDDQEAPPPAGWPLLGQVLPPIPPARAVDTLQLIGSQILDLLPLPQRMRRCLCREIARFGPVLTAFLLTALAAWLRRRSRSRLQDRVLSVQQALAA